MADNTHIEWTDATWNPITGCSVVSPGCTNCYAMKLAGTRLKHHPTREGLTTMTKAGPVWNGEVRLNEAALTQPLRWKRPRRIFVCAHGDLFHESVPDEWIDRVFAVMALSPQHTFQVLTKRAGRMRDYMKTWAFPSMPPRWDRITDIAHDIGSTVRGYRGQAGLVARPLPNVWLGVSVEDQARADERIPLLLDTPAAVRWISAEPLLGPVDLTRVRCADENPDGSWKFDALETGDHYEEESEPDVLTGKRYYESGDGPERETRLDWVVVGGESGPGARPMRPDWARALRDQCAAADVPFFMKQMTKKAEIPADLLIRDYPHAR